jgi:hypothetical protein
MLVGTSTAQRAVDISTCIVLVRCRVCVITLLPIWLLFDIIEIPHVLCKQKSNGLTRTYFRCLTETETVTNFE